MKKARKEERKEKDISVVGISLSSYSRGIGVRISVSLRLPWTIHSSRTARTTYIVRLCLTKTNMPEIQINNKRMIII